MRKAHLSEVPEMDWGSPNGKFRGFGKILSEAVGADSSSTDFTKRQPFEVEITRVPPGVANCPYHSHSTQWEFYIILSGTGLVRHAEGTTAVGPGDFFVFGPDEAHQITNGSADHDLSFYVIADNPLGDHCHYPDSDKWMVGNPGRRKIIQGSEVDYFFREDDSSGAGKPHGAS